MTLLCNLAIFNDLLNVHVRLHEFYSTIFEYIGMEEGVTCLVNCENFISANYFVRQTASM